MARDGKVALVSYENKAPPQLWKIEFVKDKNDATDKDARLSLRHTYMPKVSVDFAGPSYFGGKDDQLVLCAAKSTCCLKLLLSHFLTQLSRRRRSHLGS